METRKESLSSLKLCRFCLSHDDSLSGLYDGNRPPKNSVPLGLKILSCVSIEVFPSDKMPSYICNRCKFFMELCYDFKQICRHADESILQFVQNGTPLKSIYWPQTLNKVFRLTKKSEVEVMKTVVEGGATVQVTAQESDSEEEDDENVYNVKIGEDGTKSARVKVITSEKPTKEKATTKVPYAADGVPTKSDVDQVTGRWPCDECDCTYPLKQLLELHKKSKHRERKVQCNKCEAKFFTTYDLDTHQITHSEETLFQCVVCDNKWFKRKILLKRHEKLIHADLPQRPCPYCPATFLSLEELQQHQTKHRNTEKQFACDVCDKKFHDKSTLSRHKSNVHDKQPSFSCEYCPSWFYSVSRLQRHVRAHAGDRPYPCKYCNKSFMKSHHYTRHLRLKHRETKNTSRGPFGETEQFRCEECSDSFGSQDELIYHSAIHATQNLVCPLCQEKFHDVDAVTTHIKSHVNGTEFMCDYCELIFTTKEKLSNHMTMVHEDEMTNDPDMPSVDESSMEVDQEDEDDDNGIRVKDEGDHMVVEINKPNEFMLSNRQDATEERVDNTNSEDSEPETTYTELSTVDTLLMVPKDKEDKPVAASPAAATTTKVATPTKDTEKKDALTASILRKAEEVKRKSQFTLDQDKKDKTANKPETQNSTGANDKSLRLLEKELQELKRTNTRATELVKSTTKLIETPRGRRTQMHTPSPKPKTPSTTPASTPVPEEKKTPAASKPQLVEKKLPERRTLTKENKEPKDTKETKPNNGNTKEDKEKETPKAVVKNGAPEEGVRRSTRPSKIKDYAKMIKDRSHGSENEDSDEDDEEYKETAEKAVESKRGRRSSTKTVQKPVGAASPAAPGTPNTEAKRKRGRPRKEPPPIPAKQRKDDDEEEDEDEEEKQADKQEKQDEKQQKGDTTSGEAGKDADKGDATEAPESCKPAAAAKSGVLVSPTGQTLKKIPIKALPPGVRPMPLPRQVTSGEVCEMQIGKKVVKVQKIVMTKAEVEAMAKKGLVEMKDGTMVLKQGIKIPTSDPAALKSLVSEDAPKESPSKKEKAQPTRCDFGDDA